MTDTGTSEETESQVIVVDLDAKKDARRREDRWGALSAFGMLLAALIGYKYRSTSLYFWVGASAAATCCVTWWFTMQRKLFWKICALIALIGFTAWFVSLLCNGMDTEERNADQAIAQQNRDEAAVKQTVLRVYGKDITVTNVYDGDVDFEMANGACRYDGSYIKSGNTYALIEGVEDLWDVDPVMVGDHAEVPKCLEHPLKELRESHQG